MLLDFFIFDYSDNRDDDDDDELKSDVYVNELESDFDDEIDNNILKDPCDFDDEISLDAE